MNLLFAIIFGSLAQILPVDTSPSWGLAGGVVCGYGASDVVYTKTSSCEVTACYFERATLLILDCPSHKLQCKMITASTTGKTAIDECPEPSY
jgi:hypothetical protein